MEAAVADQFALARKECELEKTEDVALFALEAYERADKQRTELYYQELRALKSNALAAKTLMESLDGAGGERCKALAKQRKFQVVAQAKELRLTVKPHLTAAVHKATSHLLVRATRLLTYALMSESRMTQESFR